MITFIFGLVIGTGLGLMFAALMAVAGEDRRDGE